MLLLALALFLVGLASLAATTGGPATPAAARSTHDRDVATSEAWRAAAIGADADAKELRLAIASALDERDARRRTSCSVRRWFVRRDPCRSASPSDDQRLRR